MNLFLKTLINYSILIITQITLGKKGSFLYAIIFNMNLYVISVVIIISDIILMLFVGSLFQVTTKHVFPFTLLKRGAENKEQKLKKSKLAEQIIKIGKLSPMILTAIPFAGGVWSGMALSKILKLSNKEAYWLVSIGSVIGCIIFLLGALGIINLL